MRRLADTSLLCAWLVLPAAGCESDLARPTEIVHMRVLGARLEVVDDEERVTPKPGERLRVSLPVVFPSIDDDSSELQTLMIGCTAPDRYTGTLPICQELIDAALSGEAASPSVRMFQEKVNCGEGVLSGNYVQLDAVSAQCVQGDPVAVLPVLRNFTAAGVLFAGVVCERGTPFIDASDPLLFGCDDSDGETQRFHGVAGVQHEPEDENHNPSLDTLVVLRENADANKDGALDLRDWPPYAPEDLPSEEDCEDAADRDEAIVPSVVQDQLQRSGDDDHRVLPLTLRYEASAREQSDGQPEDLEFTIYTTFGEMERRFTLFEGTDDGKEGVLRGDVDWDPPDADEIGPSGHLVRFFVTLRDQRGGFAMTSRALCVTDTMQ
jgi:hypothetical protein